jgi:hypothetical protein
MYVCVLSQLAHIVQTHSRTCERVTHSCHHAQFRHVSRALSPKVNQLLFRPGMAHLLPESVRPLVSSTNPYVQQPPSPRETAAWADVTKLLVDVAVERVQTYVHALVFTRAHLHTSMKCADNCALCAGVYGLQFNTQAASRTAC